MTLINGYNSYPFFPLPSSFFLLPRVLCILNAQHITSGLIQLSENVTDTADRISAGCPSDEEAHFVTSGRGGIVQNPPQKLPNEIVLQDLRNTVTSNQLSVTTEQHKDKTIKEATGWIVNQDGVIEFVADNPISKESISEKYNCRK